MADMQRGDCSSMSVGRVCRGGCGDGRVLEGGWMVAGMVQMMRKRRRGCEEKWT